MSVNCFQASMKRLSNFKSIVKTINNSLSISPVKNNKPLLQISGNFAAKKPLKNQVIDVVGEKKKDICKGFVNPRPQFKYKTWDEIFSKTKDEDMPMKQQMMPADELSDFSGPQNPVWNSCLKGKPLMNLSVAKSDLKMMLGDDSAMKIKPLISSSNRCHDDSGRDFIEKKKAIFLTGKSWRNQDNEIKPVDMPTKLMSPLNPQLMPDALAKIAAPHTPVVNSCPKPKPKPAKAKKAVMPRESPCSHQAPVVRRCRKHKPLNSICSDSGMYFKAKKPILPCKRLRNEDEEEGALMKSKKVRLSSSSVMPGESLETVASCRLPEEPEADHSVNVPADKQKTAQSNSGKERSNINSSEDDCHISPIIDEDTYIKAEHKVKMLSSYEDVILKYVTDPIQKERERERMRCKVKVIEEKMRAYKNDRNYKKRIAARIALEKVVKSIEFNDGEYLEQQLHLLSQGCY